MPKSHIYKKWYRNNEVIFCVPEAYVSHAKYEQP